MQSSPSWTEHDHKKSLALYPAPNPWKHKLSEHALNNCISWLSKTCREIAATVLGRDLQKICAQFVKTLRKICWIIGRKATPRPRCTNCQWHWDQHAILKLERGYCTHVVYNIEPNERNSRRISFYESEHAPLIGLFSRFLDALASFDFKLSGSESVSDWCFSDIFQDNQNNKDIQERLLDDFRFISSGPGPIIVSSLVAYWIYIAKDTMVPPCIPTLIILSSKILFLWICIFKPTWPCSVTKLALHSLWLQVREKIGLSTKLPLAIVLAVAEIIFYRIRRVLWSQSQIGNWSNYLNQ